MTAHARGCRGKRGLEQVRPNPYVGELLPESYLKVWRRAGRLRVLRKGARAVGRRGRGCVERGWAGRACGDGRGA